MGVSDDRTGQKPVEGSWLFVSIVMDVTTAAAAVIGGRVGLPRQMRLLKRPLGKKKRSGVLHVVGFWNDETKKHSNGDEAASRGLLRTLCENQTCI